MSSTYERIEPFIRDTFQPPENSALTQEEWDAYSLLSAAYNAFITLPVLFPGDRGEFALGINQLKSIVMSRPVERELKSVYDQVPRDIDNVMAASFTIESNEPDDH